MSSDSTAQTGSKSPAPEKKLSSKLQTMKFMQRSADRAKAEESKRLEKKLISESHWQAKYPSSLISDKKPKSHVVYETSYLKFKDPGSGNKLYTGRKSFKEFNKNIELLNEQVEQQQIDEMDRESDEKEKAEDNRMARILSVRERNGIAKRKRD